MLKNKPKYIGISNGVKYPVHKIDPKNNKIGLTTLNWCVFDVWCTFDKIVKN